MCNLVAFPRHGTEIPDLAVLERTVPGVTRSTIELAIPVIDISSSDIRKRIAHGLCIGEMVPQKVAEYIQANSLYISKGKVGS
jgi:nicotinic acid mononucleotide adenylyltransferase